MGKYRIKSSTIALFNDDGRHITYTLPAGTVISVDRLEKDGLVEVVWSGKKFLMFAKDLHARGERLET